MGVADERDWGIGFALSNSFCRSNTWRDAVGLWSTPVNFDTIGAGSASHVCDCEWVFFERTTFNLRGVQVDVLARCVDQHGSHGGGYATQGFDLTEAARQTKTLNPAFPWETLTAVIGGASAIDVPELQIYSDTDAHEFLECYGFDWSIPEQRDEVSGLRRDAIAFIQGELLFDEPQLILPRPIRDEEDVRRLLLLASGDRRLREQQWACSILRVMHTLAHCTSYLNIRFGPEIRTQVLERFERHLHYGEDGLQLGAGAEAIPLVRFEVKHGKPARSVAVKLLHKPENVATDIFDRIGVRFVTGDRFDTLRVVRYLRQNNVIMFANVKPSRSRNSLIDVNLLKEEMERLQVDESWLSDPSKLARLQDRVRTMPLPPTDGSTNPHSSVSYHSIQFTCRQLIRVINPFAHLELEAALLETQEAVGLEPETVSDTTAPKQLHFFFPYEVQVMDLESYHFSRSGLASHDVYKARQRQTVKLRVLGPLFSQLKAR